MVNRLVNARTRGSISIKTLGYMHMNFSCQFVRTITDRETVCKAVLILQQQGQGHTFQFFVYHVQGPRYGQFCAQQYAKKQLRGYLVDFRWKTKQFWTKNALCVPPVGWKLTAGNLKYSWTAVMLAETDVRNSARPPAWNIGNKIFLELTLTWLRKRS